MRVRPPKDQTTLEGYVVANYGWRLYNHFFKTYNEKVWGVPASEIAADWGAQRIKGMSLFAAVWEPIRAKVAGQPRQGEAGHQPDRGVQLPEVRPRHDVGAVRRAGHRRRAPRSCSTRTSPRSSTPAAARIAVTAESSGVTNRYECTDVISSMPISALLEAMDPPVPVGGDARRPTALRYRDFMTVALVVPEEYGFPDNWIYIHDPDVEVGRIQNFGSWSPYLVKDGRTCLGLEFFVHEGDEMWTKSDADLVEQGKRELAAPRPGRRVEGRGRLRRADAEGVPVLRRGLQGATSPCCGSGSRSTRPTCTRSAATACTATTTRTTRCTPRCSRVENIFGADHDVWSVNVEEEYHEEYAENSTGDGARTA